MQPTARLVIGWATVCGCDMMMWYGMMWLLHILRTAKKGEKGDGPCASNPCRQRGTCTNIWSNYSYHCICAEKFTGVNCQHGNTLPLIVSASASLSGEASEAAALGLAPKGASRFEN